MEQGQAGEVKGGDGWSTGSRSCWPAFPGGYFLADIPYPNQPNQLTSALTCFLLSDRLATAGKSKGRAPLSKGCNVQGRGGMDLHWTITASDGAAPRPSSSQPLRNSSTDTQAEVQPNCGRRSPAPWRARCHPAAAAPWPPGCGCCPSCGPAMGMWGKWWAVGMGCLGALSACGR